VQAVNAIERRASLEKVFAQADPTTEHAAKIEAVLLEKMHPSASSTRPMRESIHYCTKRTSFAQPREIDKVTQSRLLHRHRKWTVGIFTLPKNWELLLEGLDYCYKIRSPIDDYAIAQ
jgi:hypothetical protein